MLAAVLRMDVRALCALDEGYDEGLAAAAACVYAEILVLASIVIFLTVKVDAL